MDRPSDEVPSPGALSLRHPRPRCGRASRKSIPASSLVDSYPTPAITFETGGLSNSIITRSRGPENAMAAPPPGQSRRGEIVWLSGHSRGDTPAKLTSGIGTFQKCRLASIMSAQ